MKKNKNIFLHIIEEDYREKSQKQAKNFDIAEKGVLFTDIKNESFVFKQLEKLHDPFITIMDSELNMPNLEIKELEHQNVFETMRSIDDLEFNDSFQAIKTQQKEHKCRIEECTSEELVLHDRLSAEISEKKKAIETLQLQILSLQNSCRELSRELSNNN